MGHWPRIPHPIRTIAVVLVAGLVASCGAGGSGDGDSATGTSFDAASRDPTTKEAPAYGLGPQPDDNVELQPDVIIVAGAGKSIRSVTDGGLTWVIDGNAEGADGLETGKVMFVTGRAVGRVLAISDDGGDRKVTIGPVTLTDVIREGTFEKKGIALDKPVEYPAVAPNWETTDEDEVKANNASVRQGNANAAVSASLMAARPHEPRAHLMAAGGTVSTLCCKTGIGVNYSYSQGGTKLYGIVGLTFATPSADFYLDVKGGRITRAELLVSGGFGAKLDFEAGIENGNRDIKVPFDVGGEFGFPIAQVLGMPISFTMSQGLTVTTAFAGNLGTMRGNGSFSFGGSLGYGYAAGSFGPTSKLKFKREASLINSLTGVPIGVMGLLVEHRVRLNVGFSMHVFKAGLYTDVQTRFGTTIGSAIGGVGTLGTPGIVCRGVGLGMYTTFGAGYSIAEPVTRVINRFLSLLNVKPIASEGGLKSSPFKVFADEEVTPPDTQVCGKPGTGKSAGGGGAGGGGGGGGTSARQ